MTLHQSIRAGIGFAVLVAGLAMGVMFVTTAPVNATTWDEIERAFSNSPEPRVTPRARRAAARSTPAPRRSDDGRSRYDRERDEYRGYRSDGTHDLVCEGKVRGLGTQWIGTEGAMDAAKKDWMERTRYDHGESYLDLTHAKDFVSRCGRVSIGETLGQVMYRCEIIARPCKGVFGETTEAGK
jgi:hypothetical protein